jgi:hypothetical protein
MRTAFAHEATIALGADGDINAPGAAITVALCGSWDHQPPCPLAAHRTHAARVGDDVHLRILFAVDPTDEEMVRQRIADALMTGHLQGPDGTVTRWQLRQDNPTSIAPSEADYARRLTA